MGTVYLGEHTTIGSRVAVKVLHPQLAAYPDLVQRFHAEARAVNLIGHDNIVNIFDLNADGARPYLIMEYLEGTSLSVLGRQPLEAPVLVPILLQVCEALQAAHAHGIVHRDLKPENVFLVRRGRVEHFVKVLDFGIAKLFDNERSPQTSVGLIVGTPEYMSPEQSLGERVDGRADLYALGVMAFQLATGRLPFEASNVAALLLAHQTQAPPLLRSLRPEAPAALEAALQRALAKRPEDRFESAAALHAALEEALPRERVPAPATHAYLAPPAPPAPPAPAPAAPRPPALELPARLVAPGRAAEVVVCTEVSRGGLVLATAGPLPPLLTRLTVTLELPAGGRVACAGEVVRHVTEEQARAWGMRRGFALQYGDNPPAVREALSRLAQGLPVVDVPGSAPTAVDEERARTLLEQHRKRAGTDFYSLLGVPPGASMEEVRLRAREARQELEEVLAHPLSEALRKGAQAALARVKEAAEALGHLERRAVLDAARGNHAGVAQCIAAGLTPTRLEALRRDYLATHPHAAGNAHVHFLTGSALEKVGELDRALNTYERALQIDPLHLTLHLRFRAARRAVATRRGGRPA
jgi:serine/threonine-protein kinase